MAVAGRYWLTEGARRSAVEPLTWGRAEVEWFPTRLRIRWWRWPLVATVGIVLGALLPRAPLRDVTTLDPVSDVTLSVPFAYLVLAPVCRLLDALSLLGTRQHYALVSTVILAVVVWRVVRGRRPWKSLREVGIVCGVVPLVLLGLYAICILIPRPMLALSVSDPDVVVVDFHSHTHFSHDGRRSFTVERNREWHRAGGWNVAYITDHMRLKGAERGMARNPRRAGDGTILLPGLECRSDGTHLVVLGITPDDYVSLRTNPGESRPPDSPQHVAIQTIPATLTKMQAREHTQVGVLAGTELADGDPRGLDQGQRDRSALLAIADHRDHAVVSASNNHGWSSAAAAWSLLRIPGWRELTPEALDLRIQELLLRERRHAVRLVERHAASTGPGIAGVAATVPAVAWQILATLTPGERLSWFGWVWGLALAGWSFRRGRPKSHLEPRLELFVRPGREARRRSLRPRPRRSRRRVPQSASGR